MCRTQVRCTQSPFLCGRPLLTCTSAGDTQRQVWLSFCGVSWCAQGLFEPSERLWWEWGLILPSCCGFSFALGHGVSFFGGISFFGGVSFSAVDSCSAVSCKFGVLAGENERTSFYSTLLQADAAYKQQQLISPTSGGWKSDSSIAWFQ